ncbi:class I SAM-dependent methyltransferase [Nocardioides sp.]|uniref:class I SAM-dependent methyltransferase n=1 Tax=Nocardioides sp. TaxID=35761 RepID=UPI0027165347|nr:class I SAM-dependent methyltransferase [Nocardioides sp.]MDO9457050.1 class I SAM-dependent methyltransferase [Nocardioides sp.]
MPDLPTISVVSADDDGITFATPDDQADVLLDVRFDGRRIGSFWALRDTRSGPDGRTWRWPRTLAQVLDGRTTLSLAAHGADESLWSSDVRFGTSDTRLDVVDPRGNPLALDKDLRLVQLLGSRSPEQLAPLLDSMTEVVAALRRAGVEPFVAYGTLLGAVREGTFIGHDSDADLGYVSRLDHPVDVMLESFELQRRLTAEGYTVTRYSGAAMKVAVRESDGTVRGLDVFAGFLRAGRLHLMGEVETAWRPEWLWPLGEVELAGRRFPAPAEPERLLEAMYGGHWRVPDPAFKFETSQATRRRLGGWFRGNRFKRESVWVPHYGQPRARTRTEVGDVVRWAHAREPAGTTLVDAGCGTGADVVWAAEQGRTAYGFDYVPKAFGPSATRSTKLGLPATFLFGNLTELRSVAATTAALRTVRGPTVMTAVHVADATNATGRTNLLRMARTLLVGGGRLYLQVLVARDPAGRRTGLRPLDLDAFVAEAARHGGRPAPPDPDHDLPDPPAHLRRLVLQWT